MKKYRLTKYGMTMKKLSRLIQKMKQETKHANKDYIVMKFTWRKSKMRNNNVVFYRIIYRDENGEIHFKDYETKEVFLRSPLHDCVLISARKFKGETSRDVTYLFRKFFEKTESI